jgi:hypothetical protein
VKNERDGALSLFYQNILYISCSYVFYAFALHFLYNFGGGCTTGSCNAVTAILEFKNIKSHRSDGGGRKLFAYAIGSYQMN